MVQQTQNSQSQANILNEIKLDQEVSHIINQRKSLNRNFKSNHQQITSVLHQESTEIATDQNTARVSLKAHVESLDQNLPTSASREMIMNTQTIPETSFHNDDLQIVKEQIATEQDENPAENQEFL